MRLLYLTLLIVCISALSCSNETKVENIDATGFELIGGGYILPPSHLFDGMKPVASWIWD